MKPSISNRISNSQSPRSRTSRHNGDQLGKEYSIATKEAQKLHIANEKMKNIVQCKDDEIDDLNNQILQLIQSNYILEKTSLDDLAKRQNYEDEMIRIADYCNDLAGKYRRKPKTLADFQSAIDDFQNEYNKSYSFYSKKIKDIDNENKKLAKQLKDRQILFKTQGDDIKKMRITANDLETQVNMQEELYNERAALNEKKYKELKKKYTQLLDKISDYELNEGVPNKDGKYIVKLDNVITPEQKEKEQLNAINGEINNVEQYNENLAEQIEGLKKKYKDVTNSLGGTKTSFNETKSTKFNTPSTTKMKGFMDTNNKTGFISGGSTYVTFKTKK